MLQVGDPPGATPLAPEDLAGLMQTWISTREELNVAEQANIVAGIVWAKRSRRGKLLSDGYLRSLHKAMFGEVWSWAGRLRTRETNIGVPPHSIPIAIRELLDTAQYWVDRRPFPPDAIAVHLHHRLVQIHPFPNGNGRHTRLVADLLVEQLGRPVFSWGRTSLVDAGPLRASYIAAIKEADRQNIEPLLAFARS